MEVTCDACGMGVARVHLRTHLAEKCPMRLVRCSRPGCLELVAWGKLSDHLRKECSIARKNAALIEEAARSPRAKTCPDCHTRITPLSQFGRHSTEECPQRIVPCPNKHLGCQKSTQFARIRWHLRSECIVGLDRAERASQHMTRLERVRCAECGFTVLRQQLTNHQRDKCPNRRVPCKNRQLGCPVVISLASMEEHLRVDRLLGARPCLVVDAGRSFIALDDADRKPPWTVELWIWRPSLVEGTRGKARMALEAYWAFRHAGQRLDNTQRRVDAIEPQVVAAAAAEGGGGGGGGARRRSKSVEDGPGESEGAREELTNELVAAATARDDAKVDLAVSAAVLANTLAAVKRGVEQISSRPRHGGLRRLALASTPWYEQSPSSLRGGDPSAGQHHHARSDQGPEQSAASGASPRPRASGASLARAGGIVDLQRGVAGAAREEMCLGDAGGTDGEASASASAPRVAVTSSPGPSAEARGRGRVGGDEVATGRVVGRTGGACGEGDGAPLTQGDEPGRGGGTDGTGSLDLAREEASFWAEWVALTGPSVATRLLSLADDTLPRLMEEVARKTGVPARQIFGDAPGTARDTTSEEEKHAREVAAKNEGVSSPGDAGANKEGARRAARRAARKKRRRKHEQQFGKKLGARIAEEVRGRGGFGTLLGSEQALVQLEMGAEDRVGIKMPGGSDVVSNYRCPRERWVHLSLVAGPTEVTILEDGQPADRLPGSNVPLPMGEIGGREAACQCLLQEVRCWKVRRTNEQLAGHMRKVLPASSVGEGLVRYWTFEEGSGEFVRDVTEQGPRARMVGRGIRWAVPDLMRVGVKEAPTPSWREQNVCKVGTENASTASTSSRHPFTALVAGSLSGSQEPDPSNAHTSSPVMSSIHAVFRAEGLAWSASESPSKGCGSLSCSGSTAPRCGGLMPSHWLEGAAARVIALLITRGEYIRCPYRLVLHPSTTIQGGATARTHGGEGSTTR